MRNTLPQNGVHVACQRNVNGILKHADGNVSSLWNTLNPQIVKFDGI